MGHTAEFLNVINMILRALVDIVVIGAITFFVWKISHKK